MIPLPSKSWSSRRSNFWKSPTMLFFCTTAQQRVLLKEQVITLYLILNLASWSVSANQCELPVSQCTIPQQHRDTADLQLLRNSPLPAHPNPCHLRVPAPSNSLLSFSSALLYRVQTGGCLQLMQSSSAPLAARNRPSGILAQALMQETELGRSRVKREAGHRERELECRSLFPGQSDMKDKNSLAKDMKWHTGSTTMQYSTPNCAGCRISYTTAEQPKLHRDKKPKK